MGDPWPCPWPGTCHPLSMFGDRHQLSIDTRGPGMSIPTGPHRHDHTRCVPWPGGTWRHPDDPLDVTHECGPYWVAGRDPIERMWGVTPWHVLTTGVLSIRTRRPRAMQAAARVFGAADGPADVLDAPDDAVVGWVEPAGMATTRIVHVRAVAALCRDVMRPTIEHVAATPGCGPHIVDTYRVHVLGDTTEPFVNPSARVWATTMGAR